MTIELVDKRINDLLISGDFEFFPREKLAALEEELKGLEIEEKRITEKIEQFYQKYNIQAPGTFPKDFSKTLHLAIQNL